MRKAKMAKKNNTGIPTVPTAVPTGSGTCHPSLSINKINATYFTA
jgi:hypothetical protein